MKVYFWPADLAATTLYSTPTRVRTTQQWDGAPGQKVEQTQRSVVEVSGETVRRNAPDLDIILDRIDGGLNLAAVWDIEWRLQNGWDAAAAFNSAGAELWRADGATSGYAGESANAPTGPWRSIFAQATAAAAVGATQVAVDGLLDSEVIPRGAMIRIGDYRYRTLSAVTASAAGAATLTLAKGLRAAVADNDDIRIPGDFFVGQMIGQTLGASGPDGRRPFTLRFREVYEDEIEALSTEDPAVGFEFVVD